MIKRFPTHETNSATNMSSEEISISLALADWAWDSHNWVEYQPGYYQCQWCTCQHTSSQGVSENFRICRGNRIVKKLMADIEIGVLMESIKNIEMRKKDL